jgi:predicted Fe-S protein YdhL (DUF1289 family)
MPTTQNRSTHTPCVGICSTTFGDLVCRGCKRFAHEIVDWNGFEPAQQAVVWARLDDLLEGAVEQWLHVFDPELLIVYAKLGAIARRDEIGTLNLAYEVLCDRQMPVTELAGIGIEVRSCGASMRWTGDLVRRIDQEYYARSLAHYEHNFKIAAQ